MIPMANITPDHSYVRGLAYNNNFGGNSSFHTIFHGPHKRKTIAVITKPGDTLSRMSKTRKQTMVKPPENNYYYPVSQSLENNYFYQNSSDEVQWIVPVRSSTSFNKIVPQRVDSISRTFNNFKSVKKKVVGAQKSHPFTGIVTRPIDALSRTATQQINKSSHRNNGHTRQGGSLTVNDGQGA